jgi:hypothetical protein
MQHNYKLILFIGILLANFNLNASGKEEISQKTSRVFASVDEKSKFLEQHSNGYSAGNNLPLEVMQVIKSGELGSEIFALNGERNFNLLVYACRIAIQVRNSFAHLAPFETPADDIELRTIPIPDKQIASVSPKYFSELPLAEQMYLINIRYNLHEPNGFTSAITKLKELTVLAQQAALETKTDETKAVPNFLATDQTKSRANFLVSAVPFVITVSTKISEYLHLILDERKKLQPSVVSSVVSMATSWLGGATPQKSEIVIAQESELNVREALAYAIFDSVFGNISIPEIIKTAISLEQDDSANNRLQKRISTLHSELKNTKAFKALDTIVDHKGEIISQAAKPMAGISANTQLNNSDEFIVALRTKTSSLLATINAAVAYAKEKNMFPNASQSFVLHSSTDAANKHLEESAIDGFVEVSYTDHSSEKK